MHVLDIAARDVREGDVLVSRQGGETWLVTDVVKRDGIVAIETLDGQRWVLRSEHLCRVQGDDPECDGACVKGAYIAGAIVNGKLPVRGTCYRCGGKGRQTREDRLRNHYYDNYVRRV